MKTVVNYYMPGCSNAPDGIHCVEACLKMILKFFWPNESYSWEDLEIMTAKPKGKASSLIPALPTLLARNVEIKIIEGWDLDRLVVEGDRYIAEVRGLESVEWAFHDSSYPPFCASLVLRPPLLEHLERRSADIGDIKSLLRAGYILSTCVDWAVIEGVPGMSWHGLVIKGFSDEEGCCYVHDPGLPAEFNRAIPFRVFAKAWLAPNDLIAFRKAHA